MTAEPDNPAEPHLDPAAGGEPKQYTRPRPPLIEQTPFVPSGGGGGLLRPLAAGAIGGLVGALIVYFASGGPTVDPDARQLIKELQDRTVELNEAIKAKPSGLPANLVKTDDLGELHSQMDGVAKAVKDVEASVQTLAQKVQAVEQRPAPEPGKDVIKTEVASQLAPIAERIAVLERSQSEHVTDARTAALTLALTNLKRAVSEGKPFATELATLESLTSAKLPVFQLAAFKDKGVPGLLELQQDFAETARNVIKKHYLGKSDSIIGEVLSRARSAVQVRPAGGTGDSVEAVLGRIDNDLKAGDLKGVLTESSTLEGPAKEELEPWIVRVQVRANADEAIRKTDQELLASLTKPPAATQ